MDAEQQQQQQQRLRDLESVCQRLWPFVRHFGLCGADPRAVEAVADMARLLGHGEQSLALAENSAAQARLLAINECIQWLEAHRFMGRKILRADAATLIQEMRQLRVPKVPDSTPAQS
jgi:hypothetical protein